MGKKAPWYKRYTDAALTGMMVLTLEERGAYNTILDLIYNEGGRYPNDDGLICGWLRCSRRTWHRIKARLLDLGKLSVEDGYIYNGRASDELARLADDKVSPKVSAKPAPKREPVAQSTSKQSNGLAKKSPPSRRERLEGRGQNARPATESFPESPSPLSAANGRKIERGSSGNSGTEHSPQIPEPRNRGSPSARSGVMRTVGSALGGAPPSPWASQQKRDEFAVSKCVAQLMRQRVDNAWLIAMAAEDPSDPRHEKCCRIMLRAAKAAGVGWVSPGRRKIA